jgi:copper resistance protein C
VRRKLTFAIAVAFAALSMLAVTVFGHAELESSDPADGATIETPYTLTATFDEELTPTGSSILVQDSSGAQVAAGTVSDADDKSMTADLPQLPAGQYTVLWTAVTADDKAVERGTYHFNVGAATSPGASPAASTTASPRPSSASPAPSPAASAGSTQNTGSGNDLLVPLAIAVVIVAAIAAYFVYRNRS